MSSRQWIGVYNGKPIAFQAFLRMPHGHIRNAWRSHRLVVMPDFQGIGIGSRLQEYIGDLLLAENKRVYAKTSNPALIEHRRRSHKWRLATIGRTAKYKSRGGSTGGKNISYNRTVSSKRITTGWEYIGDK